MNESLSKHIAEKVMGWHIEKCRTGDDIYRNNNNEFVMPVKQYDPPNNIEQAIDCLDTFTNGSQLDFDARRIDAKKHRCILRMGSAYAESRTMAISLASARATGWTE